ENKSSYSDDNEDSGRRKRRRRGRRGGRRRKRDGDQIEIGAPPADGGALLDGLSLSLDTMLGDEPPALPEAAEGGLKASAVALPMATKAAPAETPGSDGDTKADDTKSSDEEGSGRKRRRRRRRRGRDENDSETKETEVKESEVKGDQAEEQETAPEAPVDETTEALDIV
ncbi:MAG: ribonuclease E/G, partial [Pseudomonadota bacterium]